MRVLLDNNVNRKFVQALVGHEVVHARTMGWSELENGDLIGAAEREGFQVMITCDKQMRYQQNLKTRRISILVLNSLFIKWESIEPLAPQVQAALDHGLPSGAFVVVEPD